MNPYARSAVISTTAGGLLGAQGYTFAGAMALSVVAGIGIEMAQRASPGIVHSPRGPIVGKHPVLTTMTLAMMGWWVGSTFFPPPHVPELERPNTR